MLKPDLVRIPRLDARPNIDNSQSADIVFPPVTLRPLARVALDAITLIVREPETHVITAHWHATSTTADREVSGAFALRVQGVVDEADLITDIRPADDDDDDQSRG